MNLRINTKNHAADLKIGSPLNFDFSADLTHESDPSVWELKLTLHQSNFRKGWCLLRLP